MSRLMARAAALGVALVFLTALSFAPRAQAAESTESGGLGFKGMGARLGLVDPENASSTLAYGVHIDAGEFIPHLHLTPLLEYWSASVGSTDRSDLTIGTNVDWDFPVAGAAFTPYAGGGLGFHRLKDSAPGFDHSVSKLGLNVQGGIRDRIVPNLSLFGEVRFTFVDNSDKFKLMGGFTYNFIY